MVLLDDDVYTASVHGLVEAGMLSFKGAAAGTLLKTTVDMAYFEVWRVYLFPQSVFGVEVVAFVEFGSL